MLEMLGAHLRRHAVAYLALFVALGGTSYAAISLPAHSVGSKQLKRSAVTKSKIRKNAVTGSKVKNGSLRAKDFKAGDLPAGAQGPQGVPGATGARGPSDAYVDGTGAITPLNMSGATQVAALSLPPGSYVVTAKLLADNDSVGPARMDCTLNGPTGAQLDLMKLRLAGTGQPNLEFGSMSLASALTLTASGTVRLNCTPLEAPSPSMTVGFRELVAINVGALHAQ